MFQYVSMVGIAATVVTALMIVAMLYLVWGAVGNSIHTPTPNDSDRPELGESDEADEPQNELPADGNSA
ncbi:hypothetical protein [Halorubrum sp. FL23]|uniref:hypothetical protein n=1 Tax=Halorubrum sp. FL23 TaxID=3458704 RepID=UPI004033891D